jgi:hypothetical protein
MDTFSDRSTKLVNTIVCGGTAARHRELKKKKNVCKPRGNHQQQNKEDRKVRNEMKATSWMVDGLDSRGHVKKFTKVMANHMPRETKLETKLEDHPFFASIPCMVHRETTNTSWFSQLVKIEELVLATVPNTTTKHRYGANMGVNFGMSVEPGGRGSQGVWSGAIHQHAKAAKHQVELQMQLITCFKGLLEELFGDAAWCRRLLKLTTRLNEESEEDRTIPGLPLTGLWLTNTPVEEAVHCDRNVVGATFLLTTSDVEGSQLQMLSSTGTVTKHRIAPGQILAGKWANHPHCNVNNLQGSKTKRTSWTLCLDGRVFCKRFRFQRKVVEEGK